MNKIWLLAAALLALVFTFACNKQKPPKLDYTEKLEKGLFAPNGMPGDGHVGGTHEEHRYHGYKPLAKDAAADHHQATPPATGDQAGQDEPAAEESIDEKSAADDEGGEGEDDEDDEDDEDEDDEEEDDEDEEDDE
jgi:hypothetical protein